MDKAKCAPWTAIWVSQTWPLSSQLLQRLRIISVGKGDRRIKYLQNQVGYSEITQVCTRPDSPHFARLAPAGDFAKVEPAGHWGWCSVTIAGQYRKQLQGIGQQLRQYDYVVEPTAAFHVNPIVWSINVVSWHVVSYILINLRFDLQ